MRLGPVRAIAAHQLASYLREWRVTAVTVLLLCLYGLSLWQGWRNNELLSAESANLQREERRRWLNQGAKFPHSAADQGIVTVQPLLGLAAFDPGLLPFAGSVCRLEGHHEDLCVFRPAADANFLFRFGPLSPARIVQVFVPLLMILLIYPVISAERESGILKQILAAGVSGRELAAGKAMAAAMVLAPVFAVMCVVGPALVAGNEWTRAISLALGYLAYLTGLGGVFIAVAMRSAGTGSAFSWLASGWFVAAFLGPVIASQLAAWLTPIPTPMEWTSNLKQRERSVPTVEERRRAVRARLLEQYGLRNLRDLPVNPVGVELVEEDQDFERIWGDEIGQLYGAYARQDRIYASAGVLDPALAIQMWSAAAAETDNESRNRFRQAAEQYRHALVLAMNDYLVHDPHYRTSPVFPGTDIIITTAGPELWASIPPFRYEIPRFDPLGRSVWIVAALALWLFIGSAAAWVTAGTIKAV